MEIIELKSKLTEIKQKQKTSLDGLQSRRRQHWISELKEFTQSEQKLTKPQGPVGL